MTEHRGHQLKGVYAARTTEASKQRFDYFLKQLARHLGVVATIKNIASTHVTLLESCGVKDRFYDLEFSANDVRQFSARMQQRIDRAGHYKSPMKAKIDPHAPMLWVGFPPPAWLEASEQPAAYLASKLALGLVLDERMRDQRGIIEEGLIEEFGELPPIRDFSPHITLGGIKKPWRQQYCEHDPFDLLPENLTVPRTVTLNGLAVYLDRIHSVDNVLATS